MTRLRSFVECWGDLRGNADEALKLLGMLVSAVRLKDEDPQFLEDTLFELSSALCCIDTNVGDEAPGYQPPRPPGHPLNTPTEDQSPEPPASNQRAAWTRVALEARNALECLELARDEVFAFVADAADTDVHIRLERLSSIADGIVPALASLKAIKQEADS